MNVLTNGLITIVNGAYKFVEQVLSPISLVILVIAGSLIWLALIEIDELNRQGTKPEIGRGL